MKDTITGRGQIRIGAATMEIAFTTPAGRCPPQAVLPEVQRIADQVTDRAVTSVEPAGLRISCANGCGACCRLIRIRLQSAPVRSSLMHFSDQ